MLVRAILSNLFTALAKTVDFCFPVLYWLIIMRALVSWVNPDPLNPIVQFLERVTEPVLAPIRRLLPPTAIDISPVIAVIIIFFLQQFLTRTFYDLAFAMH